MAKSIPTNYHKIFHRNMLALMSFNSTTKALKACFKEGMFLQPNQEGFVQVSYFLMNIIYPGTKAFKNCWPILDRSQERAFRSALIDLIRNLNNDFGDIYPISYVVPARLMSPGGDRYMKIIWELSMLALGVQAQRESGDSECLFFQKPPETVPQHLRYRAMLSCQAQTQANLKECAVKLAALEERLKNYEELKERTLDRMFTRDKKMREKDSSAVKLLKESDLGDALVSKLLDLTNEEGILVLEEKVKQRNKSMADKFQHWQDFSSLARDTKAILEAAIKREHDSHKLILDVSSLAGCETTWNSAKNIRIAKANGYDVSLLEHICNLHDRLKAVKLVMEESHLSECLNTWKSICEEKELMESDLGKLESELEKELFGLSSRNEKNSAEGVSENDYHGSSTLIMSSAASTSTPIKNVISISSDSGFHTSVSITPHQSATSHDFFPLKLEEAHKEISDEKLKRSHQKATNSKSTDSSIDDLLERFRKIVEIREQRSSEKI